MSPGTGSSKNKLSSTNSLKWVGASKVGANSPLMDGARNEMRHALKKAPIQDARIPVYANVSGRPVRKAEDIRTLLEAQVTSAVRWEESVRNMIADGAKTFVEVGPGNVLQSLVKRISDAAEVRGIDTIEDIQQSVPA